MKKYVIGALLLLLLTSNIYAEGGFKILSVTFKLTDDKDFSGEATYSYQPTEKVQFIIKNIGKLPYNFADASYFLALRDGTIYQLGFSNIVNSSTTVENSVCNPQETITINCLPSKSFKDIKGLFITLINKRKIYFEYEELTNPRTLLRKTAETIGMGEDKDKQHPAKEGWRKGVTSSGKVYYYRKEEEGQKKPEQK